MSIARDGSSRARDRKTSTNLRAEYTDLINADEGLVEARRWIERVTFTKFKNNDFRESLADGVLLCELVVNVASMSIGRINRSSTQYAGTDNIKLFNRACEALGFEKSQLFEVDDLQEVPVKRGQSVLERAKESQQRLRRVALTVYYLGKYANEHLDFTGSSVLKEDCFNDLLDNKLPELPVLEGADLGRRISQYEPSQTAISETTAENALKENAEIVTETGNFSANRNAFKQLEQESIKQAEEEALQQSRRKSFSSSEKENELSTEEALERRKSIGSKPVWKEGDSRYKHKREILGGWKDPIKNRRERIEAIGSTCTDSSPPKQQVTMRSPVDLQKKKSKFEEMERSASEEAEAQVKRPRPKSWVAGDIRSRSGSLKDKTNKFEDLQRQADKQTLVLQGRRDEVVTDFTYDIGDKVNGPITLPGAANPKLQDKKRQFETLDYKAQRESTILRLHSGKSFDDPNHNPIPLSTASRRADPKPRPKSNIFDYHSVSSMEIDRQEILNDVVQPKEMDFSESTPDQWNDIDGSVNAESSNPAAPPRGDSLRYNSKKPEEVITKSAKTPLYSSFAAKQDPSKDKGQTNKELKYKEFISYPVVKQRDRIDRYNAAVQDLSKEQPPKNITAGEKPRKKSRSSDEWIKHKPQEELDVDLPKRQIKKIWDRLPDAHDGESKKLTDSVDTTFDERKISTHVPNVQNMSYRDFTAAPKNLAKERVISRAPVVELVSSRKKSENRNEPFSNFAQPVKEDEKNPTKKQSMSYRDFVVPPPKVESKADAAARAQKVKEMTRKFQEIEADQNKAKPAGRPALKSLVDKDELMRIEQESRARNWYGVDDEELEGATRRRVRRWSDYEYQEEDRTRDAPREMQNDDAHNVETHPSVFEESKPYTKQIEPAERREAERREHERREAERIERERREQERIEKERHDRLERERIEKERKEQERIAIEQERIERERRECEEQLERERLETERLNQERLRVERIERERIEQESQPVESAKEWYELRPPPQIPVAPIETEIQAEVARPVKSILKHDPLPVNKYEPTQPEPVVEEKKTTETHSEPRARAVGSRSWNDFESARRKKSMELLENRSTAKPTRESTKVESEPYKLKRPTDYLPKHNFTQAQRTAKPENQQPEPQDAHQHIFDSQLQDYQKPNNDSMPTSYPTYYEPDVSASSPSVEIGKPLFVSAKLHEDEEIQMRQKSPSPSPGYDVPVSEKVKLPEVESNVESEPQDFKAQQRLWEYKTTQIVEELVPPQPIVSKNAEKPADVPKYVIEPEPVKQPQEQPTKQHRPQVFAIVGTAHPVRPSINENAKPISPNVAQVSPKEPPPQMMNQVVERKPQDSQPKLTRSPSAAKVFDFSIENDEHKPDQDKAQVQHAPVPVKTPESSIVVEKVAVVEKGPSLEDDIFKSFDKDEEKMKRNLQDPIYREKLRKEVEEETRKQREETRHLTNLQMGQSLGLNQNNLIHEEQERLRQKQLESVSLKKDLYDYNANRKDYPVIEKQVNGLEHSDDKEIPLYPVQGKREDDDARRRKSDKIQPPHESTEDRGEHHEKQDRRDRPHRRPSRDRERYEHERRRSPDRYSNSDRERYEQERRGRSPHRLPSRERERYENERRQSPDRYSNSGRERNEQERRGRSPHRRQSSGRERQDQERRNRYPSSERERYEQERRGRSPRRYPSSERDRYEQNQRGRSPHRYPSSERDLYDRRGRSPYRNRDDHYPENERRGRDSREPPERRRDQERGERERYDYERKEAERRERENRESKRRDSERREHERRDAERREAERRENERREAERKEQERIEAEHREAERREAERREAERREAERREAERREHERREAERKEQERIEAERREAERLEAERREAERREAERRETERREHERREAERIEQERIEAERREAERREAERREAEQREYERREAERIERERREQERIEKERLEKERKEQERIAIEQERLERERREREEQFERERLEAERLNQERLRVERIERERIEQERIERERREQERMQRERIENERREQEKIEWERLEQQRIEQERYDQRRLDDEHRRRGHDQGRYDRERQEWERRDPQRRSRNPSNHYDDRRRDRREQERYEQDRREQERRDRHRREQEQLSSEEREIHRQEQQQRVHEMIAQQRQEEIEQDQYKEMLSKEQQYLYGVSEKRRNSEDDGMWKKLEDGSGYDIYSTFIEDERSPITCTSCGMPIVRDRAMYVRELNQYWHETCFRCVVCHVIFGSREQRSPLKVTDSLLHCENCFITNEGDKCTEV